MAPTTRHRHQQKEESGSPASPLQALPNNPKPRRTRSRKTVPTNEPSNIENKSEKSRSKSSKVSKSKKVTIKPTKTRTSRTKKEPLESKVLALEDNDVAGSKRKFLDEQYESPGNTNKRIKTTDDVILIGNSHLQHSYRRVTGDRSRRYDKNGNLLLPGQKQEVPPPDKEQSSLQEFDDDYEGNSDLELASDRRQLAMARMRDDEGDQTERSPDWQRTVRIDQPLENEASAVSTPQNGTVRQIPVTPSRWGLPRIVSTIGSSVGKFFGRGGHDNVEFTFQSPTRPIELSVMRNRLDESMLIPSDITTESAARSLVSEACDPPSSVIAKTPSSSARTSPGDFLPGTSHNILQITNQNHGILAIQQMDADQIAELSQQIEKRRKEIQTGISPDLVNSLRLQGKTTLFPDSKRLITPNRKRKYRKKPIPQPASGGYGLNEDYVYRDSSSSEESVSDSEADDETNGKPSPTLRSTKRLSLSRPSKRPRLTEDLFQRPSNLFGNPKEATPYTGSMFADRKPNIFNDQAVDDFGAQYGSVETRDTPSRTFTVPDMSDSDSDDEMNMTDSPITHRGSGETFDIDKNGTATSMVEGLSPDSGAVTSTSNPFTETELGVIPAQTLTDSNSSKLPAQNNVISSAVSNLQKSPRPPPAPIPAHATLPTSTGDHSQALAQAIAQATRYAPKQPSTLRESSHLSNSTVATSSEGGTHEKFPSRMSIGTDNVFRSSILGDTTTNGASLTDMDVEQRLNRFFDLVPECEFEELHISKLVQAQINKLEYDAIPAFDFLQLLKDSSYHGDPQFLTKDPVVLTELQRVWGKDDDHKAAEMFSTSFSRFLASRKGEIEAT